MAIVCRGMNPTETAELTHAIAHSGTTFDWSDLPGIKVDKHSSGGVGDKTTLVLAPLVAACGVLVPKMSGRGLGHSGGTLDKLEAIPGFRTERTLAEFREGLKQVGVVLAGQTDDVAPADKKLYKLRDVTATVESIPLITSSILGKKLAEGLDGLVLDVKYGRGAFMRDLPAAQELADSLLAVTRQQQLPTTVVLSGMDAPLGAAIGNALEIAEAIATLRGEGPADLTELALELAAQMVALADSSRDVPAARQRVQQAWRSGAGLAKFRQLVAAQGGDARVVDDPSRLPQASMQVEFPTPRAGYVIGLDAEQLGLAAVSLGAGRDRVDDAIDPAVGLVLLAKPGDYLHAGQSWVRVHANDAARLELTRPRLEQAIQLGDTPCERIPIIADIRMG
jgi:pyrimidine-nucleoside phosphorylase